MKISVFELNVVRTIINGNEHYLICRDSLIDNTYKEVLTGRKIIVNSSKDIEPLCDYYPVLGVANYKTGKALSLSKRDILSKCIEINVNKSKKKVEEQYKLAQDRNNIVDETSNRVESLTINERIEEAAKKMFPKSGAWSASEFRSSPDSLIQHLRDDNWLATRLQSIGLEDVDYLDILAYVLRSSEFKKLRHDYEQRIVKWQIEWMKSGGDGWLVPEGYGEDFALYYGTCDIAFRKGVVLTLSAINIDKEAIEEGLESNSDIWLFQQMKAAYRLTYCCPIFSNVNLSDLPKDKEHEEKWLRFRMYEYYQEHKDSVDKYGNATDDMLISAEEAEELRVYLAIKHEEKMADLERAKEKNKNNGDGFKLKMGDYFV